MGRFTFNPPAGNPQKEKPVSQPSRFSDIDIHPMRGKDELYCDYKCRMWWANRILRRYAKGFPTTQGSMKPNRKARRHPQLVRDIRG